MPYAMKITHQDFHVSQALISAWAQQGRAASLGSSRSPGPTHPMAWPGGGPSALGMRAGRAELGLQGPGVASGSSERPSLRCTVAPLPGRGASCWRRSPSLSRPSGWRCCRSQGRCKWPQQGKGCGLD